MSLCLLLSGTVEVRHLTRRDRLSADRSLCLWFLQPLAGDWRQRVKAAQRRERSAEPAAGKPAKAAAPAAASVPAAGGAVDLAALSAGLPPGWKAMRDKATGDVYYGNPATKVWAAPCDEQPPGRPERQVPRVRCWLPWVQAKGTLHADVGVRVRALHTKTCGIEEWCQL